jgi:predicted metal-dependent enzyme (double-stranded beta helix superfamily)
MALNSLERFIIDVRSDWAPISSEVVENCRMHLARLTLANTSEEWLAKLHAEHPASRELYRDPDAGFVLLAHTETDGLYRPPHDHGRAWVVYAVGWGELEVGTYAKVLDHGGKVQLVKRDTTTLRAGNARAYLPGDIHDTRCISETALLFRFTERDLRHEDQVEHRLTRFVEHDGHWTTPGE